MADPTDKTSADIAGKPAGKSSAVRPPVLEGKARPAGGEATRAEGPAKQPEPKPATDKEAKAPAAPQAVRSPDAHAGTAWLAGLVGGLAGLAVAYGLALFGYWPGPAAEAAREDPRLAGIVDAVPELQTIASTLQGELATLTARVSGLEADAPVATGDPAETEKLAGDLAALAARIDELAKAPQAQRDSAASQAAAIAALEAELVTLRQASAEAQAALGTVTGQVASLAADVSAGSAVEAGQARLPLIVSGFETAFATGAAYDAEVTALRRSMPDFAIPEPVLAAAMTGLKRPDLVARDFNAVLPDILGGRPVNGEAGWQEATADWFRGVIALRPTEAVEGDGPEAVVARLEGAIARGDFVAAAREFDALPPAMRSAAGPVGVDIANQAAAQGFLASLRQAALAGGEGA